MSQLTLAKAYMCYLRISAYEETVTMRSNLLEIEHFRSHLIGQTKKMATKGGNYKKIPTVPKRT